MTDPTDFVIQRLQNYPNIVCVNGEVCRAPYRDPYIGDVHFWEPINWTDGGQAGQIKRLEGVRPLRVLGVDDLSNAAFEYNVIEVDRWPHGVPKARNRKEALALLTECEGFQIEWTQHPNTDSKIRTMALCDRTLNGLIALYNASLRDDLQCWECKWLDADGLENSVTFLYYITDDTLYSPHMLMHRCAASQAVFQLLMHARQLGCRYLDIWNVSASQRELYKRQFFTGKTTQRCYYDGYNPYPWLTLDQPAAAAV